VEGNGRGNGAEGKGMVKKGKRVGVEREREGENGDGREGKGEEEKGRGRERKGKKGGSGQPIFLPGLTPIAAGPLVGPRWEAYSAPKIAGGNKTDCPSPRTPSSGVGAGGG